MLMCVKSNGQDDHCSFNLDPSRPTCLALLTRRRLFTGKLFAFGVAVVALSGCHGFRGGASVVTGLLLQRGGISDGALVTVVI